MITHSSVAGMIGLTVRVGSAYPHLTVSYAIAPYSEDIWRLLVSDEFNMFWEDFSAVAIEQSCSSVEDMFNVVSREIRARRMDRPVPPHVSNTIFDGMYRVDELEIFMG